MSSPRLSCNFCNGFVEAVAATKGQYVRWNLCNRHALSAAGCGFRPRYFATGVVLSPKDAARLRVADLRKDAADATGD